MDLTKHKVGFIHVTKTGGVDFKNNAPEHIYTNTGHKDTAEMYAKNGLPCFGIMRDPIDRFVSAYCFAKLGSDRYTMGMDCSDINSFIRNQFQTGRYHEVLFRPQVSWFRNGDPNTTYILKYSSNNNENISQLLHEVFGIRYDTIAEKANVSNREECYITESNMEYLFNYYQDDIRLFRKLDGPYMKLCELL
jgi:hypothetical protein